MSSPPVKRRNPIAVWDYFKKEGLKNDCQIENCNFKYNLTTTRTSLAYHLRNHHNILTTDSVPEDDENTDKRPKPAEKASLRYS